MTDLRALTIRQPWADAIVHGKQPNGPKRVENRTRPTKHRGVILIHAGVAGDRQAVLDGIRPGPDVRGAIIGVARLAACHIAEGCCRPWGWTTPKPYTWHWVLEGVHALPEPIPARGQLGLWRPGPDVLAAVEKPVAEGAA